MRKLISIVIALAVCGGALAQQKQGHVRRPKPRGVGVNTVVGQAQLEVQYAFNATDIKNQNTYIDLHCLLVGKDGLSKQYSVFLERSDSLYDAYLKSHPNAEGVPSNSFTLGRNGEYWSEYQYTEIFTEDGMQTFYSWMPWAMEKYNAYYTEPTGMQKWTVGTETQLILGHKCQKATCNWRGRNFVAWFASDIPVRLGPWKFNGLPGLILKVYDTEKLYVYEAVSLRSGNFAIKKRDYNEFGKDSRNHIYRLQVAANRDHLKTGGAINRKTGLPASKKFPYDPLEKE
jgi:GLPGLI family protein